MPVAFKYLGRLALGCALTAVVAGCSLESFERRACTTHAQCRTAFGFGAVCGPGGYCSEATPTARCATSYPAELFTEPAKFRKAIVFASLMDLSSEAHKTREKAIRLAIKAANDAGGLDGRKLALVMCDIRQDGSLDGSTRTEAAVASANFVGKTLGVPAIIGPSASTDTEQVWQAVHSQDTLVISPAATSPALSSLEPQTSDEQPGLLWRTAPTDSLQGRVIADDMLARGVNRATVIRETGSYGEGLANVFAERFAKGGGQLTLVSLPSEASVAEAARAISADDPSEVLFVSSQQKWIVNFLTTASSQPSYANRRVFLTDAAANQAVITEAMPAAAIFPRVRGTRPAPRDASEYVLASFVADFRAEYAGANPMTATFSAHAYDAAWLGLYGAAWALTNEGNVTGKGLGRGLRRVSAGAETPILPASWAGVLAAFRAGQSINVKGASGDLDYHPMTRELTGPIEIWTIGGDAGQFTMVKVETRTPKD